MKGKIAVFVHESIDFFMMDTFVLQPKPVVVTVVEKREVGLRGEHEFAA